MNKQDNELNDLLNKRQDLEQGFMDKKAKEIKENQAQFDDERAKEAEEYNFMKIQLETTVQKLEQDFQQIQATFQLNQEKLEYNYLILYEKDMENLNVITLLKRKHTRLQDALSSMTTRYNELNEKYRSENNELTEDYKRVTEQFKDLQTKFLHFQRLDAQRYLEVWSMNERTVTELMQKVLLTS
jgi:dynein regulatory complex protein 1